MNAVFKNFKSYVPITVPFELRRLNVLFLKSEDGYDWYECQKQFAKETMKITFDEAGVICGFSEDVSALWPINLSVAEVTNNIMARRLDISGNWVFDGKTIVKRVLTVDELTSKAEKERQRKLEEASNKMRPLEYAVALNMQTKEEEERLVSLKEYYVLLSRIDMSTAYSSALPPMPE